VTESVRPLSPEETATLLDRREVRPLPGIARPKIFAVMVTCTIAGRQCGEGYILRRAFRISKSMWTEFVARASCGVAPWFSPDRWHCDQHEGCIYQGSLFDDGGVFDDYDAGVQR
jgi:hypothetical protein